eukprot:4532064-Prorocentrum_lima.AAC.1
MKRPRKLSERTLTPTSQVRYGGKRLQSVGFVRKLRGLLRALLDRCCGGAGGLTWLRGGAWLWGPPVYRFCLAAGWLL